MKTIQQVQQELLDAASESIKQGNSGAAREYLHSWIDIKPYTETTDPTK